ncbi:MAG: phosphoglucosamine mutase [Bacteroidales bacterium]|nr:phosphoglucosamine mutase [Bacteroidales bacterium]
MTLIKSISGIRGTIGGNPGAGLTPVDIINYTAAYAAFIQSRNPGKKPSVVVGRDARISGEMVERLVLGTLVAAGVDVIDTGLSTTPTVEVTVIALNASGGIIITASHNPRQWNALKLLNEKGEFLNEYEGRQIIDMAETGGFSFADINNLGSYRREENTIDQHIESILKLPLVDGATIRQAKLRIVVDAVNSTGGIAIPKLLRALGVQEIIELYCEPNGHFPHDPEPIPENLSEISAIVKKSNAHLGFVVDPDVDRLAIVDENGDMFGEEYTLVAVTDYVLSHQKGNTVSNLSSSNALKIVTERHGGSHFASAVGEVNVVEMMKANNAVIGGEGNGGIIYPTLHYGRDALVGIALFLTQLVKSGKSCSSLRSTFPDLHISKNKIQLDDAINLDDVLKKIEKKYINQPKNTIDGIRIEFDNDWVHLRKSNTEPIIRIYAESDSMHKAEVLARKLIDDIRETIKPEPE